jgi:hypothetical protein
VKPVSDETLNDEAAGERVQTEQRRQLQHNAARAMESETGLCLRAVGMDSLYLGDSCVKTTASITPITP